MKGDFSRSTFDSEKRYSGVLMQQGRVQLDSDWNEQLAIARYQRVTENKDIIGKCGAPRDDDGFEIRIDGSDLRIGAGRYYVDGILCESDAETSIGEQPHIAEPFQDFEALVKRGRDFVAYLEVWERHVTSREDPALKEPALHGPDTTTRIQTVWQVKLAEKDEYEAYARDLAKRLNGDGVGRLSARAEPGSASGDELCLAPTDASYSGLENQLYRVEIHDGGKFGAATFKWSRENGSVATRIESLSGQTFTVEDLGRDEVLGFSVGNTVEIVSDHQELAAVPTAGQIVAITAVNPAERTITVDPAPAMSPADLRAGAHFALRRWDQDGDPLRTDAAVALESGIEVVFEPGSYEPGDYWLIPARTARGDIEWPIDNQAPAARVPEGIYRHVCKLALLRPTNRGMTVEDCRELFSPLSDLRAKDVDFDNSRCKLSDVASVQDAIDELCRGRHGGGCAIAIGRGREFKTIGEALEALRGKGARDVCLCLLPEQHTVKADEAALTGFEHVSIVGCGPASRVFVDNGPLRIHGVTSCRLGDLHLLSTQERGLLDVGKVEELSIERCLLEGREHGASLARLQVSSRLRISDCTFRAHSRAGDKAVETMLSKIHPELARLQLGLDRQQARKITEEAIEQVATLSASERKQLASSIGELTGLRMPLRRALERRLAGAKKDVPAIVRQIPELRDAALATHPGSALIIADGQGDVWIEGNVIHGTVSLYGEGSAADNVLDTQLKTALWACIALEKFDWSTASGTLHFNDNRVSRLAVARELADAAEETAEKLGQASAQRILKNYRSTGKIAPAPRGVPTASMGHVFDKLYVRDNVLHSGRILLMARNLYVNGNCFETDPGKPAGAALAKAALYTGNHAPDRATLANISFVHDVGANLGLTIEHADETQIQE